MNDAKACDKKTADALKTSITDLGSSDDSDKIEPLVNWLIKVLTNLEGYGHLSHSQALHFSIQIIYTHFTSSLI